MEVKTPVPEQHVSELATSWLPKPAQLVVGMFLFTGAILVGGLTAQTWLDTRIAKGVEPVSKELAEHKTAEAALALERKAAEVSIKAENIGQLQQIMQKLDNLATVTNSVQTDVAVLKARAK